LAASAQTRPALPRATSSSKAFAFGVRVCFNAATTTGKFVRLVRGSSKDDLLAEIIKAKVDETKTCDRK
jgi:hypothetical protein